ncbi:hypothetical protein [Streptomyces sp. NBC_00154]|uniref:hypothetical protein n=1 Tax=Streptomyces sp. NBC_00154 TaxID=2975670 RepID=UPI00225486AB|nr:hypothetical protein [Streptomyces sp. NBC_00154]MCX5317647.1 hypothetical protein [Streptomyces sp. NBC_00154]
MGIVDALGADVTSTRIGQRIAHHSDLRRQCGLAQYAVAEAAVLAAVPARLDAVAAAALPCAAMTAYQAVVRRLRVEPGDTVLVTGGAGGVGGFAVQLASLAGGHVIATASTWNADHVLGLGAHEVFDYHSEDIAALVACRRLVMVHLTGRLVSGRFLPLCQIGLLLWVRRRSGRSG